MYIFKMRSYISFIPFYNTDLFSLTPDDTCCPFLSISLFTWASATPPFIYRFLHNQFNLPPCLLYKTCSGGVLNSLFLSRIRTRFLFWDLIRISFGIEPCRSIRTSVTSARRISGNLFPSHVVTYSAQSASIPTGIMQTTLDNTCVHSARWLTPRGQAHASFSPLGIRLRPWEV